VDALLSWLPAWLEAFDRRQLVTNCRWLSADDCGMADFAAHQIFAQPAIVWG
jgi:hypothetical protein